MIVLRAHWDVLGATDFTTIEVWTKGGLVTIYLLFVMEVGTRRVHFAGSTTNPTEPWMKQVARNLTDSVDGFLNGSSECLNRMIFFGEKPVRKAAVEFLEHYHAERNHQGLDNRLIEPSEEVGCVDGKVECHERLGGLLHYYYRDAA